MPATFDLEKIKKLVATATSPKQKQMYQGLLDKALKQQEAANPPPLKQEPVQLFTKSPAFVPTQEPKLEEPAQEKETTKKQKKKKRRRKKKKQFFPDPNFMFQAIGVIKADVTFDEKQRAILTLNGKPYWLGIAPGKAKVYEMLYRQVVNNDNKTVRLAVHPRIRHFPPGGTAPFWSFGLIGFQREEEEPRGVLAEFEDFEFKLLGLWQFIEVCNMPCISIYRNYDHFRGKIMKKSEPAQKVKFAKASHLPIIWPDPPAEPFRYNPDIAGEEREFAKFVQVKAKFLPEHDCFEFISELAPASNKVPHHLRISQKDRAAFKEASTANA